MSPKARGMVAACALGASVTWNLTNVGAAAEPTAGHYGISLAVVGLFTTVLFLAELSSMAAVGGLVRRHGAKLVGLGALALCAAGNVGILLGAGTVVALALRFAIGFGVGLGFVGGTAYVQHIGGGPLAQGIYGGLSLAAAGLAVALVPSLEGPLGWGAPFTSAIAILVLAAPLVAAGPDARGAPGSEGLRFLRLLIEPRLLRFASLHVASFGLAIVLSNWVVTLLSRRGDYSEETAGLIGALILLTGILARSGGGVFAHLRPSRTRALLAAAMGIGAAGTLLVGLAPPPVPAALGAVALGLAAGIPFGPAVAGLGRVFPGSPGAAFGAMNSYGLLTVVVGTPLVGLTFSLPGDGLIGFVAAAAYWAFAVLVLPDREALGAVPAPRTADATHLSRL